MYLEETGCVGVHWIQLAQDMIQWRGRNDNKVSNFKNVGEFLKQLRNYQLVKENSAPRGYLV